VGKHPEKEGQDQGRVRRKNAETGIQRGPDQQGVQTITKQEKEKIMPYGPGTYGSKVGRPPKKKKKFKPKKK